MIINCFERKNKTQQQSNHLISFIFIQIVEIDFEVGHSSTIRSEPITTHDPPRTHDWKVYLRSADTNGDLNCLIHRCVFNLHPDFPHNKRGEHRLKTTRNENFSL